MSEKEVGKAESEVKRKPRVSTQNLQDSEDLLGIDPESLDPEMHYRWINDRPARRVRAHAMGYRPVSRANDEVRLLVENDDGSAEDVFRNVDTILMACPKDRYIERREKVAALTRSRLKQPEGSFRKKARAGGAIVVDHSNREPI